MIILCIPYFEEKLSMNNINIENVFLLHLEKQEKKLCESLEITQDNLEECINTYLMLQQMLCYFFMNNPELIPHIHKFSNKEIISNINVHFIAYFFQDGINDNDFLILDELIKHQTLSDALIKNNRTLYELTFRIPEEKRKHYIFEHNFLDFSDPEIIGSLPDMLYRNKHMEMNVIKMIFDKTPDKELLIQNIMSIANDMPAKIQKKFLNNSFKKEELRPYAFLYLSKMGYLKSVNYLLKLGYKPNQTEIHIFNILANKFKNNGNNTVIQKLLSLFSVDNYHTLYSHIINKKHDKAMLFLNSLNQTDKEKILNQIKEKQQNFNYNDFETNIRKKAGYRKNKETPLMINAIMAHDIKFINHLLDFGYILHPIEKDSLLHALIHLQITNFSQWQPVINVIIENKSWQQILSQIQQSNFIYPTLQDNLIAGFQLSKMLSQVFPEELSHSDCELITDLLGKKEQGGLKNDYLHYYLYNKMNQLEHSSFISILDKVLQNSQNHADQDFFAEIIMNIYEETKEKYDLKKELSETDEYEQNPPLVDACIKKIDSIVERKALKELIKIESRKTIQERL